MPIIWAIHHYRLQGKRTVRLKAVSWMLWSNSASKPLFLTWIKCHKIILEWAVSRCLFIIFSVQSNFQPMQPLRLLCQLLESDGLEPLTRLWIFICSVNYSMRLYSPSVILLLFQPNCFAVMRDSGNWCILQEECALKLKPVMEASSILQMSCFIVLIQLW